MCSLVFYSAYHFFEGRNVTLRGTTSFAETDDCGIYADRYQTLFGPRGTEMGLGGSDDDEDHSALPHEFAPAQQQVSRSLSLTHFVARSHTTLFSFSNARRTRVPTFLKTNSQRVFLRTLAWLIAKTKVTVRKQMKM
jgi:hypothetical protein